MNIRKIEFVFLFVVEYEAMLLNEADDRRLPARALDKSDQTIENPVLKILVVYRLTFSPSEKL
jgi:hypothetical protein